MVSQRETATPSTFGETTPRVPEPDLPTPSRGTSLLSSSDREGRKSPRVVESWAIPVSLSLLPVPISSSAYALHHSRPKKSSIRINHFISVFSQFVFDTFFLQRSVEVAVALEVGRDVGLSGHSIDQSLESGRRGREQLLNLAADLPLVVVDLVYDKVRVGDTGTEDERTTLGVRGRSELTLDALDVL